MAQKTHYLKDYTVPDFLIKHVSLTVDIGEKLTQVQSKLAIKRNPASANKTAPLQLDGEALTLGAVFIDDKELAPSAYQQTDTQLIIPHVHDTLSLQTTVAIDPDHNTKLSGLYRSSDMYCTQCESHGFRRITYYIDRPDVMAKFTTKIIADRKTCPILLSNGNLTETGNLANGRHFATWEDPFKKPAYLFALVAGDLVEIKDHYTTRSGKPVDIYFYVEHGNQDKCDHAIASLKKAMRWDEENYGREYDLDRYMVVAVSHFNSGAMENKGLNIFNDKYVLAKPELATDQDYINIEAVIGHEYFHNWTGNRITCRDWFQLSLKEGLTVFREQQFSQAMNASESIRIADVEYLETHQFPEDASPMAHPVQPTSYIEVNNFYTSTVYNKGAEVIRMLHTILGAENFRRGMDVYFDRHDGQAVTIEDFVQAMAEASERDFAQFMHWYTQAGTPEIFLTLQYNPKKQTARVDIKQTCPPTPGQSNKKPFYIPIKIALFDPKSKQKQTEITLYSYNHGEPDSYYIFEQLPEKPIVSALRSFSAPVKLHMDYSDAELQFLITHDDDACAKWAASRQFLVKHILHYMEHEALATSVTELIEPYRHILTQHNDDPALRAKLLQLPDLNYLSLHTTPIDIQGLHNARSYLREQFACGLESLLFETYQREHSREPYQFNAAAIGARQLKNTCLQLLLWADERYQDLARNQFEQADNMTDRMAALQALSHHPGLIHDDVFSAFYQHWEDESLVVDKWFAVQAQAEYDGGVETVGKLLKHPQFELTKPNRVYALLATFALRNPSQFHVASGAGYALLTDYVLQLNEINPQVGARLLTPLARWQQFVEPQCGLMQKQLERLSRVENLSPNIYELVSKYL